MAEANIDKLIKEQEAIVADLTKQLVAAQQKRDDLKKIANARILAAKHNL